MPFITNLLLLLTSCSGRDGQGKNEDTSSLMVVIMCHCHLLAAVIEMKCQGINEHSLLLCYYHSPPEIEKSVTSEIVVDVSLPLTLCNDSKLV